jgi:hypothetical protein
MILLSCSLHLLQDWMVGHCALLYLHQFVIPSNRTNRGRTVQVAGFSYVDDTDLHDRTGVDRIPTRELNNSVTQEWQNGDTELLPQDKVLIQGTSLPQLLQTSQDHKLAWLAQIRLA